MQHDMSNLDVPAISFSSPVQPSNPRSTHPSAIIDSVSFDTSNHNRHILASDEPSIIPAINPVAPEPASRTTSGTSKAGSSKRLPSVRTQPCRKFKGKTLPKPRVTCLHCDVTCARESDMRRHVQSLHPEIPASAEQSAVVSFLCPFSNCPRSRPEGAFNRRDKLRDHCRRRHDGSETRAGVRK
jgi:hypothetical protein